MEILDNILKLTDGGMAFNDMVVESCDSMDSAFGNFKWILPFKKRDELVEYIKSQHPDKAKHIDELKEEDNGLFVLSSFPLKDSGYSYYTEYLLQTMTPQEIIDKYGNKDKIEKKVIEEAPKDIAKFDHIATENKEELPTALSYFGDVDDKVSLSPTELNVLMEDSVVDDIMEDIMDEIEEEESTQDELVEEIEQHEPTQDKPVEEIEQQEVANENLPNEQDNTIVEEEVIENIVQDKPIEEPQQQEINEELQEEVNEEEIKEEVRTEEEEPQQEEVKIEEEPQEAPKCEEVKEEPQQQEVKIEEIKEEPHQEAPREEEVKEEPKTEIEVFTISELYTLLSIMEKHNCVPTFHAFRKMINHLVDANDIRTATTLMLDMLESCEEELMASRSGINE